MVFRGGKYSEVLLLCPVGSRGGVSGEGQNRWNVGEPGGANLNAGRHCFLLISLSFEGDGFRALKGARLLPYRKSLFVIPSGLHPARDLHFRGFFYVRSADAARKPLAKWKRLSSHVNGTAEAVPLSKLFSLAQLRQRENFRVGAANVVSIKFLNRDHFPAADFSQADARDEFAAWPLNQCGCNRTLAQ